MKRVFQVLSCFGLLLSVANAQTTIEQDMKEAVDIANVYGKAWSGIQNDFEGFIKLVKERDEKLKRCSEIFKKYSSDMEAKNENGRLATQKLGWVKSQFNLFFSQAQSFADDFVKDTEKNLEHARLRLSEAEKLKAPALCEAATRELDDNVKLIRLLQAFNGDEAPEAVKALAALEPLRKEIAIKQAALIKATKREVKAPVEKYSGADKEKHRSAIKSAWKAQYSSDKILKIVFPDGWTRKSEWNHNGNGNYSKSDMSFLVAWVIVQKDSKTATMYPAYVNKNNLSGSISYGVQTKGGAYVNDDIELSKLK